MTNELQVFPQQKKPNSNLYFQLKDNGYCFDNSCYIFFLPFCCFVKIWNKCEHSSLYTGLGQCFQISKLAKYWCVWKENVTSKSLNWKWNTVVKWTENVE